MRPPVKKDIDERKMKLLTCIPHVYMGDNQGKWVTLGSGLEFGLENPKDLTENWIQ